MADYGCIESGFNTADETINFGVRSIADCGNLYEAVTVAVLKNTGEIEEEYKEPQIKSQVVNGKLFLQVNKSLRVFQNTDCSNVTFQAIFEDDIIAYCTCNSGNFLLVGFASGCINFLQLETEELEQKLLFDKTICDETDKIISIYLKVDINDVLIYLIVLQSGKILELKIQKPNGGDDGEVSSSVETMVDLQCRVDVTGYYWPIIMCGSSRLLAYNTLNDELVKGPTMSFKRLLGQSELLFMGIDKDSQYWLISSVTMHCCKFSKLQNIAESYVLSDDNSSNSTYIYKMCKANELGQTEVQLLEYPSCSVIFSIKTKERTILVHPDLVIDHFLYVTEVSKTELRLQKIIEAAPEKRLEKLLKRKEFDKAEQLVKEFNLDMELIRKARALEIIEQITSTEQDIDKLIGILNNIEDLSFKLNYITDVTCQTTGGIQKILEYGCQIYLSTKLENHMQLEILQMNILEKKHRFNTFLTVYKNYKGSDLMNEWSEFQECDLLDTLKRYLQRKRIDETVLIYQRLDSMTAARLDDSKIQDILTVLNTIPVDLHLPFLTQFIPTSLHYCPMAIPLFVAWLKKRIYYYENRFRTEFPENAITFAERILKLLQTDNTYLSNTLQSADMDAHIKEAELMMEGLQFIRNIQNNYVYVSIHLSDYLEGCQHVIRVFLSIQVFEDMNDQCYEDFLKNFLSPYIIKNNLSPDEIYLEVLHDIVQHDECYWIKFVPFIINTISSIANKLNAVITILDSCNLPWSKAIHDLTKSVLSYDHPLVQGIRNKIVMEPVCVILKKPKYKLQDVVIRNVNDLKMVMKRILYFKEATMLNDIYQVCTTDEERQIADVMLMNHYIKRNEIENAANLFNNYKPENIANFANIIIEQGKIFIDSHKSCVKLWESHKSFFEKIYDDSYPLKDENLLSELRAIKAVLALDNIMNVTTADCRTWIGTNQKLVDTIANKINEKLQTEEFSFEYSLKHCLELSVYLNVDKAQFCLAFCQELTSFTQILQVLNKVYSTGCSSRVANLFTMLVIEKMQVPKVELSNPLDQTFSTIFTPQESISIDVQDVISCLKVCRLLINENESEPEDLAAVKEVYVLLNLMIYMLNPPKLALGETNASYLHFTYIRDAVQQYRGILGDCNDSKLKYVMAYNDPSKKFNMTECLTFLEVTSNRLINEGQTLTAQNLLETFKMALARTDKLQEENSTRFNNCLNMCTMHLLNKAFISKELDKSLILQNLSNLDPKAAWGIITKALGFYKQDIEKFKTIAEIGFTFRTKQNEVTGIKLCRTIIQRVTWWKQIDNCQVSYKDFIGIKSNELLEKLVVLQNITLEQIIKFCNESNLDNRIYLGLYLKHLLLSWKPEYDIKRDFIKNTTELIVKNTETDLYEQSMKVIDLIDNPEMIYVILMKLQKSVNFYHHEVQLCIINILRNIRPNEDLNKEKLLLFNLKSYVRVSKPGPIETEFWFTNFPNSRSIYPLSEYRLAFTPCLLRENLFHIIKPEITLKTYKMWLKSIESLSDIFSIDDICIYAVREAAEHIKKPENEVEWVLYPQYIDLIKEIEECVSHITNLEKKLSVLYHVGNSMPLGSDQEEVFKLCYKIAIDFKEESPLNEENLRAFVKIEKKYFGVSATHILHSNSLALEKYLQLVTSPADLIVELYNDNRIVDNQLSLMLPQINEAVDELGALFKDIDVYQKRQELLKDWLSDSQFNGRAVGFLEVDQEKWKHNMLENNLKRAIYLCKSVDIDTWQNYLIAILEGTAKDSYVTKARALKVYCAITDNETIQSVLQLSHAELRNYIDKLMLISDLQQLGFEFDIDSLTLCNKIELLKKLKLSLNLPIGVKTMASLCITYEIFDVRIWKLIITKTIQQKQLVLLRQYVQVLKNVYNCSLQSFYAEAWQVIVDDSYNISPNLEEEVITKKLIENITYIQSCPVLEALNFEKVFKICIDLQRFEFAALFLKFVSSDLQEKWAKELTNAKKDISRAVGKLSDLGVPGIQTVQNIFQDLE